MSESFTRQARWRSRATKYKRAKNADFHERKRMALRPDRCFETAAAMTQ
jgi:hypothetical protein